MEVIQSISPLKTTNYLQLGVQRNQTSWSEGQSKTMSQWEPVPVLSEDQSTDYGKHIGVTGSGL